MPRRETPADVLDGYAFDYGLEYYGGDDGWWSCFPCSDGTCDCCVREVEKLCAEDEPEPRSVFVNRPRRRT